MITKRNKVSGFVYKSVKMSTENLQMGNLINQLPSKSRYMQKRHNG
jgi:hypothetical protein